jgi:hypothetical protein
MPDENTAQDAPTVPARYTDSPAGPKPPESAPVAQDGPVVLAQRDTVAFLTRDAILAAPDLAIVEVEVPEWGGTVRVRALNGTERDAFEASCMKERKDGKTDFDPRNMRAKLVALCLVDANGLRIFQQDDVKALGRKSARALSRVFDAAASLNGLSDDDVKSLEGNSDGQDGGSSSVSPWPLDEQ